MVPVLCYHQLPSDEAVTIQYNCNIKTQEIRKKIVFISNINVSK